MKGYVLLGILLMMGLLSCNNSEKQVADTTETDSLATTIEKITVEEPADFQEYPTDSFFISKVLTTGIFHSDEVLEDADKMNWVGLFKNKTGYYLAATKIKTSRVHDPIVDEDKKTKTGWKVQTTNKDSALILVEALPFLKENKVQQLALTQAQFMPGDSLKFNFINIEYQIFAKGKLDGTTVLDYKLYLKTTQNGQTKVELLSAQLGFEDAMIRILFAGDIDGDGLLDLVIDNSNHYNGKSITLYLSKPAENGALLKVIGGHRSVGC